MARSRVEVFEQIRRDRRVEGLSIRELAARHGVHRRTVRQALASALPPPRKQYPSRPRPAIDAYVEVIDGWLIADQTAPAIDETPQPMVEKSGMIMYPGFPADDLYQFRLYALGTQIVIWATIGLVFGTLVSRLLEDQRRQPLSA